VRSEVFLRENLISLLAAIAAAQSDLAQRLEGREAQVYTAGFIAALRAVATALGIDFRPEPRPLAGVSGEDQMPRLAGSLDGIDARMRPSPPALALNERLPSKERPRR
jgi:hypothetical protein